MKRYCANPLIGWDKLIYLLERSASCDCCEQEKWLAPVWYSARGVASYQFDFSVLTVARRLGNIFLWHWNRPCAGWRLPGFLLSPPPHCRDAHRYEAKYRTRWRPRGVPLLADGVRFSPKIRHYRSAIPRESQRGVSSGKDTSNRKRSHW